MTDNPLYKLKITICGDYNSVRTLMNQFNPNLRDYTKFMGFSNATKLVRTEKFNAKFIIWSLEKSSCYYLTNLYSGSLGFIIPFDQTIEGSFDRILNYRMQFRGIPTFLVSNKADFVDETLVGNEEIQENLAELIQDEDDLHYVEIDTNTGEGIDELFEELANKIIAEQKY